MSEESRHFVAVIGGAVSGSVAAEILAEAGMEVAIIEQNERPYGKIEDGLPRWHVHQRTKEYERIDGRLGRERIHFIPCTKLGRDVSFGELVEDWGVSAVLLANGAWRDRPLRLDGAEEHLGKGIVYQNPFIYWFNHKDEKGYDGPQVDVPDGAIIFGGGLASIDVAKVCQLELYGNALRKRGVDVEMIEMEKKGIPATCAKHGIDPAELGIAGCLMLYRRRQQDMPLAQPVPNATPEQMEKTFATRAKLLGLAQQKYLFRIQDKTLPQELVFKDGRVTGVKVIRTEVDGRKATPIPGTEGSFDTGLIISSIGSIPEPIEGIRMQGEVFAFKDWDLGVYDEEHGVFGVGNVVTGQGNIRASLLHAQKVTEYLKENYFAGALGAAGAETVQQHLEKKEQLPAGKIEELLGRVRKLQERAGHDGDYAAWIQKVALPE
jgi:NADPH-dependent glutamate synthase beta subunit-like oxidoreductase